MLDRWQAWFIHCDGERPFPQWLKTSQPGQASTSPTGRQGVCVGPFADKHAAHRFIEILEDAFDLCRYHHILVQAPHGSACAYKEMGRCPAPCDGSIAMSQYLEQIRDSIAFARSPDAGRQLWEQRMRSASAAMDFETAQRCKTRLERTAAALKPKFRHVRDLNDFRVAAVLPSERAGWARLMLIDRGRIVPLADVSCDAGEAQLAEILVACEAIFAAWLPAALDDAAVDNIGMICRHLMQARVRSRVQPRRRRAVFLHLADGLNVAGLRKAISAVCADSAHDDLESPPADDAVVDQEVEGA
jgi:excinuclease UvrABC nuclease subunit